MQILDADFNAALGISGSGPVYVPDAQKPLFNVGGVVFRLASLPALASGGAVPSKASIACTVLQVTTIEVLDSPSAPTVVKLADQTRAYGTSCINDGATTRTYTGWNHTTATPAATTSNTTRSKPYFYRIQDANGVIYDVHEMDITNQAAVETYIGTNFASIWP